MTIIILSKFYNLIFTPQKLSSLVLFVILFKVAAVNWLNAEKISPKLIVIVVVCVFTLRVIIIVCLYVFRIAYLNFTRRNKYQSLNDN